MNRTRVILCTSGKNSHVTKQSAQEQVDSLKKAKQRTRVHVYLCPKCGFYHVGHYDPEVVKKHARWRQILLERAANRKQRHEKEN